ncbi:MAG: hypothetical protein AB7P76_06010 [Candidatus Melainabacteria bacterium]
MTQRFLHDTLCLLTLTLLLCGVVHAAEAAKAPDAGPAAATRTPVLSLDDIWRDITAEDLDPADDPLASVNLSRSQRALKEEALLQNLYLQQAQSYLGLIQAGLADEAAGRQITRAQQQWEDTQTAFSTGKAFQFDVLKAQAGILAARQAQLKSRQQYEETLRKMVLPGDPPLLRMLPVELANRVEVTLDGNMDDPLAGLSTLKTLPDGLTLTALQAMDDDALLKVAHRYRQDWALALKVKLNDQVHRAYLNLIRTIPQDITVSRQGLETAGVYYRLAREQEDLAQDVFNQLQKSVQGGFSSQRELDDARYALLQAQDSVLLSGMTWRLAALRYLHTLGLLSPRHAQS